MTAKAGPFCIEFEKPFETKIERLMEFVKENELLGVLDKRYALQWLSGLNRLSAQKLKISVRRRTKSEAWSLSGEHWTLSLGSNTYATFEGTGSTFEDAIISVCESVENCVVAG